MKNRQLRSGLQALIVSGSVIFFAACNSGDYTKNASTGSETTPADADTTMNNTPAKPDTMSSKPATAEKQMAAPKKKGRITVGTMNAKATSKMKPDKNGVYEMAETGPLYPGGHTALQNYIDDNINYPQSAIDNNSEGTVQVQFVVDENGKVADAKVIGNKVEGSLADEAVRVVSNMPKWTPGKVKGKSVKARIVLPITYKMEE